MRHLLYQLTGEDAIGLLCAGFLGYLAWQVWRVAEVLRALARQWGLP